MNSSSSFSSSSSTGANGSIASLTTNPLALLFLVPVLTFVVSYLAAWITSPLKKFPGPPLASFTNFYRMYFAHKGTIHTTTQALHAKYGPVVRMAPNYLDLDYDAASTITPGGGASLIKQCFDTKGVWKKTEWHAVSGFQVGRRWPWGGLGGGAGGETKYNIFSEVRPQEHSRMKKPVAKYWTTASVARMEPHVDRVIALLVKQLEGRFTATTTTTAAAAAAADAAAAAGDDDGNENDGDEEKKTKTKTSNGWGKSFDFGEWCLYFGWDAVAQTTWSHRIGFLDAGTDLQSILSNSAAAARYLVTVGMYPLLDQVLDKNPIVRIGPPSYTNIVNQAVQILTTRMMTTTGSQSQQGQDKDKDNEEEEEEDEEKEDSSFRSQHTTTTKQPANVDFLDCYLQAQQTHPDVVDVPMVLSYMLVNLAAGADTTAATLRTIFYHSLRNRRVWTTLETAILLSRSSSSSQPPPPLPMTYTQARAIPYLEAVIRESLRLVPGNLFPQERYVPPGGLTLPDGQFVPEGTAIGFNAYVTHRNKAIWGHDADEFRPERWLQATTTDDDDDDDNSNNKAESDEAYAKRMRLYNDCDLSFGAGSRKCIGMNLGLLEVYKTVATLVAMFEFELVSEEEWTLKAELFPKATGIVCRIRRREGASLREDVDTSK